MRVIRDGGSLSGARLTRACVLVPTMGALHDGHAALVELGSRLARERGLAGGCAVSIFVNPTQFDDPADFRRYPRTLEADLALCERAGASAVIVPSVDDVYPPGAARAAPALPRVATAPGLEDAGRPGHFAGVCAVVRRLFEMVGPAAAVFGEKDWQQLQVVRAMSEREGLGVEIVPAPTVREPSGLAMSSRNVHLSAEERERALSLWRALSAASEAREAPAAAERMRAVLRDAGVRAEYAVVRDARSLEAPTAGAKARSLVAARVGQTRLIDNAPWPAGLSAGRSPARTLP